MATTAIYPLLDALVTAARAALPAVQVFDGFGITEDPGDFLMIGVDDPDRPDAATAATGQQKAGPAGSNRPRDEEGTVRCVALSWNGDADPSAARAGCKTITAGVETLIRTVTMPALGIAGLWGLGFGDDFALSQDQGEFGAVAIVVFSIRYRARLN